MGKLREIQCKGYLQRLGRVETVIKICKCPSSNSRGKSVPSLGVREQGWGGGYQKLEKDLELSEWPPSSVGNESRSTPWPAGRQSRGLCTRPLSPLSLASPAGASPWPNTFRSQRAKGTVEAALD